MYIKQAYLRQLAASTTSVQKRNAVRMYLWIRRSGFETVWNSIADLKALCLDRGFTSYQFNVYFPILQRMGAFRLSAKTGKVYIGSIQRLYEQAGCPKSTIMVDLSCEDMLSNKAFLQVCSGCAVASTVRLTRRLPKKARRSWNLTTATATNTGKDGASSSAKEPVSVALSLSLIAKNTGRSKATASRMLRRAVLSGIVEAKQQLLPFMQATPQFNAATGKHQLRYAQVNCPTKAAQHQLRADMAAYGNVVRANRLTFVDGDAYERLPNIVSICNKRNPQRFVSMEKLYVPVS